MNTTKILELEQKRDSLYAEMQLINDEINKLQNEEHNFVGCYVISDYGYMYITYQKIKDGIITFRGLSFNSDAEHEWYDDAFFDSDGYGEWRFPINTFYNELKSGEFNTVTREEFIEEFNKKSKAYINLFETILKNKEDKVKK